MKKLQNLRRINPFIATFVIFFLSFPIIFYGIYLYLAPDLPNMKLLKSQIPESQMTIYSHDGVSIGSFGDKLSFPIKFNQIPKLQIAAFLSAEDSGFYDHAGVSVKSLARAIYEAITGSNAQTGGSTITMQVAKNYFLSPERTLSRKLTEVFLAREMEISLTKNEILELYVNKIFLGHHAYGIKAAALTYYSKPLDQLSIAQMAMLAGLPKAPSKYNPINNPKRSLERRNWILGRMLQLGYITKDQYQKSILEPDVVTLYAPTIDHDEPYVSELVRSEMVELFGDKVLRSGYQVFTTIDEDKQQYAASAIHDGLESYDRRHGWRGAEANGQSLSNFKVINNMVPVQIIKITGSDFTAKTLTGETISVPWNNMSWAKKYYSADRIGATNTPKDIVKINDIVRVRQIENSNSWELVQLPKVQGELIALNPQDGAIKAVVGGYDFSESTFNRSVQGWRQAGSTIKPFIYSFALERGFTPNSIVQDAPLTSGKWQPQNSDHRFLGAIPLRKALYLSRNLVSIRLLQAVGIQRARIRLNDFGFDTNKMPSNLTLSLGTGNVIPLQVATGYSTFANGGYRIQPYLIDHILDQQGHLIFQAQPFTPCPSCMKKQNIQENTPKIDENTLLKNSISHDKNTVSTLPPIQYRQASRILKPSAAYDMANILRDVIQVGTGVAAKSIGRDDIGGKTGTTSDSKDAWFSGFHPTLVAVAWVGFDNPSTLGRREFGGIAALPVWSKFMANALKDTPRQWVDDPESTDTENTTIDSIKKTASTSSITPPSAYPLVKKQVVKPIDLENNEPALISLPETNAAPPPM